TDKCSTSCFLGTDQGPARQYDSSPQMESCPCDGQQKYTFPRATTWNLYRAS
ncbi:hypothetical protein PAXRUDRAFT_833833, partial [Paxillus rubicundulus Ve08.2h10]